MSGASKAADIVALQEFADGDPPRLGTERGFEGGGTEGGDMALVALLLCSRGERVSLRERARASKD